MKTNWLFPHRYRLIGWIILLPSVVLGLATMYWEFSFDFLTVGKPNKPGDIGGLFSAWPLNFTNEVAALGVIIGLLFVAFAREKEEDEMISQLRLESLQWSVYTNYMLLALATILIHGGLFLEVMTYNMFTILLIFIIRFRLLLRKNKRELDRQTIT